MKQRCWQTQDGNELDDAQRKVWQGMIEGGEGGFLGGLNAEKYIKMTGVSKATATRDLSQMLANGQLRSHGAGKSVRYCVNVPEWTHGVAA